LPPFLYDTEARPFADLIDTNASMEMKVKTRFTLPFFFPKVLCAPESPHVRDSCVHACHQYGEARMQTLGEKRVSLSTIRPLK
jgi:hypothetical protein